MRIGQEVLSQLTLALEYEWLLGNGIATSASGTAAGANSRRTHACLVAGDAQGRLFTTLLRVEERAESEAVHYDLGVGLRDGEIVRPAGHLLLDEFRLDPWPIWTYRAGETLIE